MASPKLSTALEQGVPPSIASPAHEVLRARPARRRRGGGRGHRAAGPLFVAPFLVLFLSLFLAPLGYAAYLSLFQQRLVGGTTFVGLGNYVTALKDPLLLHGVLRVAEFFVIQVPLMLLLALLFALALDSGLLRLARAIRIGIFMPYAVPGVVATLMWGYLYGPDFGPFAQLSRRLDLPAPHFLSDGWMLGSLANIVTWEFVGYNMIILYAALRTIPQELYEAAAMDGAGAWRTAWSIKLPALRPTLLLVLLFSVIGSFQLFNEPSLMMRIAPDVISSSYTANLYAYSLAFTGQQLNYAATVSFLLGLVIVIASYAILLISNRRRAG
ncbi:MULTISPECIES: carbohydrate ABC transporter permease [unclassified Streptomyces]|uniref:carbohydrate ABC transporter permease n=1 Tax=unclassified Streptomyces TaxID=2593676 RepID=UPI0038180DF3